MVKDDKLIIKTLYRHQTEPVQNLNLFKTAWHEFIELQTTSQDEWVGRSLLSMQGLDRYEIGVFRSDGIPIAAMIVGYDFWDAHVGPCMSVFAQYVLPDYRNRGISLKLMREAIRITRDSEYNTLAYTHRKGDWRYETIYRRVP